MNPNRIREAVGVVAERLRKNEAVNLDQAIVGTDVEEWLEDLAHATIARDTARIKKTIREGQRKGWVQTQIALPGLEHAALPTVVWRKDQDGSETAVPLLAATFAEMKREVLLHRRAVALMDKVVSGWEASLDRLEELGVTDDTLGAEIIERFSAWREVTDGEA